MDQGREWILRLYIQETLAHLRTNTSRAPHLQTSSKQVCYKCCILISPNSSSIVVASPSQNHIAERFWVEINSRVNHPVKTVLIGMQERS